MPLKRPLDTIGETPAPEDVFPVHHEDFKDFLYQYHLSTAI